MKQFRFIFLLLLIFIATSCREHIFENERLYKIIDVGNADNVSVELNGYITDVVALETIDKAMIQDVSSLFITDSYIIVFDKPAQQVLQFDRSGKFIRRMSQKGRGPNELPELREVVLYNNMLYMYGLGRKLLVMDMNGHIVNNIQLEKGDFISFQPDVNGVIWTYLYSDNKGNRDYYLTALDNNLNIKDQWDEKHHKSLHVKRPQKYFFKDVAGDLYFHHHLSDYIYKLDNNEANPMYRFDFGKNNNPDYAKISKLWKNDEIDAALENRTCVGDMVFIGEYLLFSYSRMQKGDTMRKYAIYNAKENKTYILNHSVEISFYLNQISADGMEFYRVIQPHWLKGKVLKEYEQRCGRQILEDDNPIIIIDKITDISLR